MNLIIIYVAVIAVAAVPLFFRARKRWRENDRRIDEATRRHAYLRRIAANTASKER